MTNNSKGPTPEQLTEIGQLIDKLEASRFNFLDLKVGDIRITLGSPANGQLAAAPYDFSVSSAAKQAEDSLAKASPPSHKLKKEPKATPGCFTVKAPMIGKYYAQQEPGAPAFVKVGDTVDENTTVALIEVMKVFNAVSAGVRGRVKEVLVSDGEMVEFDQDILIIEPA